MELMAVFGRAKQLGIDGFLVNRGIAFGILVRLWRFQELFEIFGERKDVIAVAIELTYGRLAGIHNHLCRGESLQVTGVSCDEQKRGCDDQ